MVVGNGLMAKAFDCYKDNPDVLIFASGVSNSLEDNQHAFQRESSLLEATIKKNPDKLLVYFSTCSIYDDSLKERPYLVHKLNVEQYIQKSAKKYLIFRVSNVVGEGGNKNTLINFFFDAVRNQYPIKLHKNATRNIIDIDDVFAIINEFIYSRGLNQVLNVAHTESTSVVEIYHFVERYLNLKGQYTLLDQGENYTIDVSDFSHYFEQTYSGQEKYEYFYNVFKKYFS